MPPPSPCVRCAAPLAVESDGGLCPACLAETSRPAGTPGSLAAPIPAETASFPAPSANRTASFHAGAGAAATVTRAPAATPAAGEPDTASDADPGPDPIRPEAPPGYELLGSLGDGGMGDVYLARDARADQPVAIKFLKYPGSSVLADRFLRELQALRRLDHPNIVRVYGHDFDRAVPFFTMEYLSGGTLSDRVKRDGPLDPTEAARLTAVIARAVHAAHGAGLLHRDLKPLNVLLTDTGIPKVADFGLAKWTGRDEELTASTGALGTPGYMPPEQISRRRFGEAGAPADVYGLGATLYHLLTGRPPFVGETAEVLAKIPVEPPVRVRALRPEVPLGLEAVCLKCLEKDPADRYPTAAAVADDLEKFLAGERPAASPLTRARRLRRWASAHRARLAAASAAVVAVGLLVWAGILLAAPVPKPNPDPIAEMRKELAAGKPVELIRDGKPVWHQWRIGSGDFGVPPVPEKGVCYFDTGGIAAVDFFPRVGLKRFRVTAGLKHHQGPVGGNPAATYILLYVGGDPLPGNGGLVVQPLLGITFNDFEVPSVNAKPPRKEREALLRDVLIHQRPPAGNRSSKEPLAGLPFFPSLDRPGPVRVMRLDVTESSIGAAWLADDGRWTAFRPIPGTITPATRRQRDQLRVEQAHPGSGVAFPEWSPEGFSVGVLSEGAGVAVHSLVVEPFE